MIAQRRPIVKNQARKSAEKILPNGGPRRALRATVKIAMCRARRRRARHRILGNYNLLLRTISVPITPNLPSISSISATAMHTMYCVVNYIYHPSCAPTFSVSQGGRHPIRCL